MPTPGINQGSDIASFVVNVYEQADTVARDLNLMAALVRGFDDRMGTATRTRSEYGTATIKQVNDYDDLTSEVFKPTADSVLTPYEYGDQFFITDTRRENDPFNYANEAASELGKAMAQSVELNLLAAMGSVTGGTLTSSGNMTWGLFLAMQALLRTQNPGQDFACVMSPFQWHSMGTAVAPAAAVSATNAPDIQNALVKNYWMGRFYGVDVYTSANLPVGTAVTAAMFTRDALAVDLRRPQRIEPERDASRRGYELNLSMIYAYGIWRPKFGVKCTTAGTAPTA